MNKFTGVTGRAAPLLRANIDTDVVIRIDRLIGNRRGQLGPFAFEAWRTQADGSENPDFVLNQAKYRGCQILVAGENFGCGSSREAAAWALIDFGFRCVIAPSFGDIFAQNCFQNGVLCIALAKATVEAIAAELDEAAEPRVTVDLETQAIETPTGTVIRFEIDSERRLALLEGLDEISLTLKLADRIDSFRRNDRRVRPWIYRSKETEPMKRVLILAGDGIGPEVLAEVRRIAEWFRDSRKLRFELREELFGLAAWERHGSLMCEATWQEILASDAILFGAIGSPDYAKLPAEARQVDQLLRMRRELDLFTNLRPVRTLAALADTSTLRPEVIEGCDMMIVRELCGGIYFGTPRGIEPLPGGGERAVNTTVYTSAEIERIARAAFDLARVRRGRLCSVDKANVLVETGGLWRKVVQALHERDYPDVELSHMYVDNCAMQLVRNPRQFDVLVMENLFGDIISDCAAMVAGSLGMLPSASIGPRRADGSQYALYEPIHGSAPDIAGLGIANPLGAILSFALCLRYTLQAPQEADRLERAVEAAIAKGARTADIAAPGVPVISTRQMGEAVYAELAQAAG